VQEIGRKPSAEELAEKLAMPLEKNWARSFSPSGPSASSAGTTLTVIAQLVEAGSHVWADRYDRNLTDIFASQDEITLLLLRFRHFILMLLQTLAMIID
jgi:hypothetical protein